MIKEDIGIYLIIIGVAIMILAPLLKEIIL